MEVLAKKRQNYEKLIQDQIDLVQKQLVIAMYNSLECEYQFYATHQENLRWRSL